MAGVGEVNVYSSRLSMRVWLDADKITALNIPVDTIKSAIEGQNYQPSLGSVGAMPGDGTQQMVYTLQTRDVLMKSRTFRILSFALPSRAVLFTERYRPGGNW